MPNRTEVEQWFDAYDNPMKAVVLELRKVVLAADARIAECIKWKAPTFTFRGNMASFFPKSKKHASLMFHEGAKIPGTHALLEGTGDTSRVLKVGSVSGVRKAKPQIQAIVRAFVEWKAGQGTGRAAKQVAKKAEKDVVKKATKKVTKKVMKKATKKVAKNVAESTTKKVAKKVAKNVAESTTKKVAKKATKKVAKKAPKKVAKKQVVKKATKQVVKKATKRIARPARTIEGPTEKATKTSKAKPVSGAVFDGFSGEGIGFLAELALNNEREWFEENKPRYEALVREPALAFIRAMQPELRKFSPHFVGSDQKVGGSLMRIHRDVRFSKDKSPYKTNVGIHFRHEVGKDVHAPGVYVHLEPERCFLGVGIWRPEGAALEAIRGRILERPDAWRRVTEDKAFRARFSLGGDSLKRPPRGIDPEHPLVEDLKRKDHLAVADLAVSDVCSAGCVASVGAALMAAKKYVGFLCAALDLPV